MRGFGSLARLYDGEFRSSTVDVDFYLEQLRDARVRGPVLELGCGTGRVAAPLAEAGYRVTGLDFSESMLRRARRRRRSLTREAALRLRLSLQDMRSFRFNHVFDAVLVPFSSFALLAEARDRTACLECVARHLGPFRILIVDLPAPAPPLESTPPRRRLTRTFLLHPSGHEVEKTVDEEPDPARGVTHIRYRYRVLRPTDRTVVGQARSSFDLARIQKHEIQAMLYDAGFDVDAVFGDYRANPYQEGSPRLIVRAVRLP